MIVLFIVYFFLQQAQPANKRTIAAKRFALINFFILFEFIF